MIAYSSCSKSKNNLEK